MLKLISATPSPYARKVRIALAEKGIPFELITEVPWNSTTATPKYNPLEKLPVLLLEDGSSVYESSYILDWLELKYPQTPLLPTDVDGILAAKKLDVLCNGVCDAVVLTHFERQREAGASAPCLAVNAARLREACGKWRRSLATGNGQWARNLVWATLRLRAPRVTLRFDIPNLHCASFIPRFQPTASALSSALLS